MNGLHRRPAIAGSVIAAMMLSSLPFGGAGRAYADERELRCESRDGRYRYCSVDTDNRVTLRRQLSKQRCVLWSNWGYDKRGVWVDRGCRGEFIAGKSGGLSGGQTAAIGAVAGAAIIAAVIASKKGGDKDKDDKRSGSLPVWAHGTYRGYDKGWNGDIELTVYEGSAVEGYVVGRSQDRFTGRFEKDRLYLGPDEFKVKEDGDGFTAKHVRDGSREIKFRRVS